MSTLADCPRCGSEPVEAVALHDGGKNLLIPACPCYPHPPRCPFCTRALDGDKCMNLDCWAFGLAIPVPDTDPLWRADEHPR